MRVSDETVREWANIPEGIYGPTGFAVRLARDLSDLRAAARDVVEVWNSQGFDAGLIHEKISVLRAYLSEK